MSGEGFTVDSEHTLACFIANAKELFEKHKYFTYGKPRLGKDRSIDQNALFHVWLTEYAAELLKKHKSKVTKGEIQGMKRGAKGRYYLETHESFMIHKVTDPKTGQSKNDYTSSKAWSVMEMFNVLNWLQMEAANDGLVLESKGQHAKLKREYPFYIP